MMVATPDGRIARYLYGINFASEDIRLGLLEAADGRTLSTVEKILIYCYRYDPNRATYVVMATRIMKIGGALTALVLGIALLLLWRRELRRGRSSTRPLHAGSPADPTTQVGRT
jgi:protein SCO1